MHHFQKLFLEDNFIWNTNLCLYFEKERKKEKAWIRHKQYENLIFKNSLWNRNKERKNMLNFFFKIITNRIEKKKKCFKMRQFLKSAIVDYKEKW